MKEKNIKEKTQQKKKMGLTTKIFVALIAGAILGIILCYLVPDSSFKKDVIVEGILYVIGQGFIRLMKMLVVPLVFCSLVCGSMSIGDTKKLGTVGVRTLVFYLATTALAVSVALTVGNLINPGVGLDMSSIQSSASSVETMEATSLTDTILNIIPDNPINSLASGTMLQVIVFALIVGVILAKMGERAETVANFFSQFNDIMMEMTMMIMALAPIGVFCLISRTFANIGFSAFIPLAKYMIGVLLALAIQCFGVYQILLKIFTGLNPIKFIKKFFPVMAFVGGGASARLRCRASTPKASCCFTWAISMTSTTPTMSCSYAVSTVSTFPKNIASCCYLHRGTTSALAADALRQTALDITPRRIWPSAHASPISPA